MPRDRSPATSRSRRNGRVSNDSDDTSSSKNGHGRDEVVDFPSLKEIRAALPAELFKPRTAVSLYYAARDLVVAGLLLALGFYLHFEKNWFADSQPLGLFGAAALYAAWAFSLGTTMWGLFVIGHDCGHGSFSRNRWLNLAIGSVTHSLILTPFFAWRATHRSHHKNTGNIDKDEIFQPIRESNKKNIGNLPFFLRHYMGLGLGWFTYLLFGYAPRMVYFGHHLWPLSFPSPPAKFAARWQDVTVSHACLVLCLIGLYMWAKATSWATVGVLYVVPLYIFGSWLVVTTFLHHSDRFKMPWLGDSVWTYVEGQASTIDRSYGKLFDNLTHNIGTHQVHHLFPQIPHYNLQKATAVFRREFPELVRQSSERNLPAFFRNVKNYSDKVIVDDEAERYVL